MSLIWKKRAGQANSEVQYADIATQVSDIHNPWLIFSKYIDTIDENCVETMLPKWGSRLGGAQEFMSTQCFTMTDFGRVDPSVNAILQNSTTMTATPK